MNEHGLGRLPSPFDERDYLLMNYMPTKRATSPTWKLWDYPYKPLDQGLTPHCVGFGIASFGNSLPVKDSFNNVEAHALYYACKKVDRQPAQENGSTIRSAAKVMKARGMISQYAFAHSMAEVRWWALNQGPMLAGTEWTSDMFSPNKAGFITPTGESAGGHCWLIEGVRDDFYYGRCCWGQWGIEGSGLFLIRESDLAKLFRHHGEILAAVELPNKKG